MAYNAAVGEFDQRNSRECFLRLDAAHQILQASSGKDISRKMFLLASLGSVATNLVKDLLAPKDIAAAEVTFDQMREALLSHHKAQKLEMAERSLFYAAVQNQNESVAEFFSRLKRLAKFCNFGTHLDEMLRDRLALGCRSIEARRKLLQTDKLTLKMARDTLDVFEAVEGTKVEFFSTPNEVHDSKFSKGKRPITSSKQSNKRCFRCGRAGCNVPEKCLAFGKTCRNCGKQNHFASVCRNKRPAKKTIHYANNNEEEQPQSVMHINSFPMNSASQYVQLKMNGKSVTMELDTGASSTLISEVVWRKIGSPKLNECTRIFRAYDGHLMNPLGEFESELYYESKAIKATITVIKGCKEYGLLGRDHLASFFPKCNQQRGIYRTASNENRAS